MVHKSYYDRVIEAVIRLNKDIVTFDEIVKNIEHYTSIHFIILGIAKACNNNILIKHHNQNLKTLYKGHSYSLVNR